MVEAVLLRPLPYPEADRVAVVHHRDLRTGLTKEYIGLGDYIDLTEQARSFSVLGAFGKESARITRLLLWLLGAFALTALLLAGVGIYAVMAYVVRQQTREIGTRIALGALERDILKLVLGQGAMLAATGTLLGLGVGLAAARALRSTLYGVSSTDPLTLIAAAVILGGATMAACYLPARRAAGVDPARTLVES